MYNDRKNRNGEHMLKLILGKAGTGKTAGITQEISSLASAGEKNIYLIVPEQFSHEAERELCRVCGDSLSTHAEVLSFTSLARKVKMQAGGIADLALDKGGKLLCMGLAMRSVGESLEVFRNVAGKPEFQNMILSVSDEMKAAGITPEEMAEASRKCSGELAGKLRDLSAISEAYNAIVSNGRADPSDDLSVLVQHLGESSMGAGCRYYIDGFTDFTGSESKVIEALLKNGADLTVCLNVDSLSGINEIFAISRQSALKLLTCAKELGVQAKIEYAEEKEPPQAALFAENIFVYTEKKYPDNGFNRLYTAENASAECEFAAAKCLELVHEKGCRWRDIAVAARGFSDYKPLLERAFERYGVPLFASGKTAVASKPLVLFISLAYEITQNGWRPDDLISYLGTGLTGLSEDECDTLSEYVYKWQLFENSWRSASEWKQHPDGYGAPFDEETELRLQEINTLRRRIAAPLLKFRKENDSAATAGEHAKALADFLENTDMPRILTERAELAEAAGKRETAEEDAQLWGIAVNALEQTDALAGAMTMDTDTFSELFSLLLSKYDIGIIPVSLDRVSAGDFDRMRRRNIRHLIILGAEESRLPGVEPEAGIFSSDERKRLEEADIILGSPEGTELWREFTVIYNCVALPSDGITICCPAICADGSAAVKSVVMSQAEKLFGIEAQPVSTERIRLSAFAPALELALQSDSAAGAEARRFFSETCPGLLEDLKLRADLTRKNLSKSSIDALYGEKMHLSASRAENFFSCKYAFFCKYGLKAKPYRPNEFSPADIGTFVHYVLENVAKTVAAEGGFGSADEEHITSLTNMFIQKYIAEELADFQEKTDRFVYLFKRTCGDVLAITLDMARELKKSGFLPLAFELNFGKGSVFSPIRVNDGNDSIRMTGIADRIDGWEHDGKMYLRVVDYKTGKKEFSLEDLWYGRNMQMILYLYSLKSDAAGAAESLGLSEGLTFEPAGVMYIPARNSYVRLDSGADLSSAEKARKKELKRSGLVLRDEALINAWEYGEDKIYIPSSVSRSKEDRALVSSEQFDMIFSHVRGKMGDMMTQLRSGDIKADPYETENGATPCEYCDFKGSCGFCDGENGEAVRPLPKLAAEDVWEKLREESTENERIHAH